MAKPIAQIRREHFLKHLNAAGGVEAFVKKYEGKKTLNPDYLRQLKKGGPKPSGANLGSVGARKFEDLVGDPPNSWDQDMEATTPDSVEELRQAIGALYTVVGVMRPDAGIALHAALKAKAPPHLFAQVEGRNSYLTELLAALDVAVQKAHKRTTR